MQSVEAKSLPRDVRAALASVSRVMITQNIYTNTRYAYFSFFVNPLYWTDALDKDLSIITPLAMTFFTAPKSAVS